MINNKIIIGATLKRQALQLFITMTTAVSTNIGVLGFTLIMFFFVQIVSGVMVSFSLVPETMLIPVVRDEEDIEDLYTDDFFWLHERGVDILFISAYAHLFRKLYILNSYFEQDFAWKTGVFLLMFFQVVTFLGLVLCTTHLSDITLKIAANTLHTIFSFKTKVYWWLFTDKNLNTDTLVRLAYAHYLAAFLLFFISTIHGVNMHYDWKADFNLSGIDTQLNWFNEVLLHEITTTIYFVALVFFITAQMYHEPDALAYELFMWGDVGAIVDIKFNQVAPHWYFRPLMAFLLVIPHALIGVFGLAMFFFLLYFQAFIVSPTELTVYKNKLDTLTFNKIFHKQYTDRPLVVDYNFTHIFMFYVFLIACLYTTTFLPNGKYYQLVGGNSSLLFSYFFILSYLAFPNVRNLNFLRRYWHRIMSNHNLLKF